jgi:thioredoxin 1
MDRVLQAGLPVILVFVERSSAERFKPELERVAKTYAGQALVVQTSLAESPAAARRFQVNTAPAVVAVRDGQSMSKAEQISPSDLEAHARFLLGKGPRPQVAEPEAPRAESGGASSTKPVAVTDASFEQEVMRSTVPVVVDFWAPWCGPCRMVAPVLDKLAAEWSGRVKIAKINVDENPRIAGMYGVQAIPTMMVVKNGKIAERWAGALPEGPMRSRLAGILGI